MQVELTESTSKYPELDSEESIPDCPLLQFPKGFGADCSIQALPVAGLVRSERLVYPELRELLWRFHGANHILSSK